MGTYSNVLCVIVKSRFIINEYIILMEYISTEAIVLFLICGLMMRMLFLSNKRSEFCYNKRELRGHHAIFIQMVDMNVLFPKHLS